jgi:hypothetical protein
LARLGNKDYDGAWNALEKMRLAYDEGGLPFQCMCPLLHAQAECEMERKDLAHARTLAERLVQVAVEFQEPSYAARGQRLLAEMASREDDFQSAADHISQALAALERCEAWAVEWRVHASAAHMFSKLGRHQESEDCRDRSRRVAQRVAATLVDEPALQQSFLRRVQGDLAARS